MKKEQIISQLQVGDTLLHHNTGFLPRNIQKQMKKYSKKTYNAVPEKIMNHMDTIVKKNNELQCGGAIREGYIIRPLEDIIRVDKILNGTQVVLRPIKPFTKAEMDAISTEALRMEMVHTPYEMWNFIWWLVYINTNFRIFIGKPGLEKVFCFEAAWHLQQITGRLFLSKQVQFGTSVDMQFSNDYKPVIFVKE